MAKLDLNRVPMPKQEPEARAQNYDEVARGYTEEDAQAEASRCIRCKKRPCVGGCPVGVYIPEFVTALQEGDMAEAVRALKANNALPGICGRVCPQETQCEEVCTLAKKGAPVAIGRLERYVADWELNHQNDLNPAVPPATGKRVAVVGSGPAGLTVAADLAKLGHQVTMFESLHVAGGVLMYGIPEFRLPKRIVQTEADYVRSLGVEIKLDSVIGKTFTVDKLLTDGYDAVFLGTGAGLPMFLNIPGEQLNGVYSANEFLTRINLMKAYLFPEYDTPIKIGRKVAVIGGGNVAMDAARCALRLGAAETHIIYRRSRSELPARLEEVENAEEEGVIFKLLTGPLRFLGNDRGWVTGMECIEMELGEPDDSGRRRPIPKAGSEFTLDVDTVVVAVDEETGETTKPGVWAGGDVVTGAATVISAMGAGKRAAAAIDAHLRNK